MLSKKVIFLSFYQCFKIFIFTKKTTTKKTEKTFEKDTEITIDNVIFKFFNKNKVILSKKSIFRLIMTSNIFHLKIIFYIGKMVSKKFWRSKKSFLSNNRAWSTLPPPSSVAEKTSKSAKILPMGISTKTRKTRLSIVKRFLPKFSKKHVPMGILTKIFKNLPVV